MAAHRITTPTPSRRFSRGAARLDGKLRVDASATGGAFQPTCAGERPRRCAWHITLDETTASSMEAKKPFWVHVVPGTQPTVTAVRRRIESAHRDRRQAFRSAL